MSDLEAFTKTVRDIEKKKLYTKRNEAAKQFRASLQLVGEADFATHQCLNGMTVYGALQAICNLDADRQIEKAVEKAMNKIATRFLEDLSDDI